MKVIPETCCAQAINVLIKIHSRSQEYNISNVFEIDTHQKNMLYNHKFTIYF